MLHRVVNGPFSTLRRDPNDILCGVFDITCLAMHAVLRVDLQAVAAVFVFDVLIHASRAVARLRATVLGQINTDGYRSIFQC